MLLQNDEDYMEKNDKFIKRLEEENSHKPYSWINGLRLNENINKVILEEDSREEIEKTNKATEKRVIDGISSNNKGATSDKINNQMMSTIFTKEYKENPKETNDKTNDKVINNKMWNFESKSQEDSTQEREIQIEKGIRELELQKQKELLKVQELEKEIEKLREIQEKEKLKAKQTEKQIIMQHHSRQNPTNQKSNVPDKSIQPIIEGEPKNVINIEINNNTTRMSPAFPTCPLTLLPNEITNKKNSTDKDRDNEGKMNIGTLTNNISISPIPQPMSLNKARFLKKLELSGAVVKKMTRENLMKRIDEIEKIIQENKLTEDQEKALFDELDEHVKHLENVGEISKSKVKLIVSMQNQDHIQNLEQSSIVGSNFINKLNNISNNKDKDSLVKNNINDNNNLNTNTIINNDIVNNSNKVPPENQFINSDVNQLQMNPAINPAINHIINPLISNPFNNPFNNNQFRNPISFPKFQLNENPANSIFQIKNDSPNNRVVKKSLDFSFIEDIDEVNEDEDKNIDELNNNVNNEITGLYSFGSEKNTKAGNTYKVDKDKPSLMFSALFSDEKDDKHQKDMNNNNNRSSFGSDFFSNNKGRNSLIKDSFFNNFKEKVTEFNKVSIHNSLKFTLTIN